MQRNWLVTGFLLVLIATLWLAIFDYHHSRTKAVLRAWVEIEAQLVREAGQATQAWLDHRINSDGITKEQAEREAVSRFIAPLNLLETGSAAIYTPSYQIHGPGGELSENQRNQAVADVFITQRAQGARHYENLVQGVLISGEGADWYVWDAEVGPEWVAWTSIRVGDDYWTIALATPEREILAYAGVDAQLSREIWGSAIITLLVLGAIISMWLQSLRQRRHLRELETTVRARTAELMDINNSLMETLEERRKAQDALKASEYKFRTLADTTASAIFIIQGERFLYMNKAGERLTGRSAHELTDIDFWDVVHPDFQGLVRERGAARQRGEEVVSNYEFKIINPHKGELWLDFTASYLEYEGRQAMLGTAFDITERKAAEQALHDSEARYRTIIESIEEGYYETDLNGRIIFLNESLARILGRPRQECLGLDSNTIMHEEDRGLTSEVFLKVYETRAPAPSFEVRLLRPDGAVRHSELSVSLMRDKEGKPTGFRGIARDTTERKLAEAELRASRERYRAMLEANPDPVVTYDTAGRVVYFNPAFANVFGWSMEECRGRRFERFIPERAWPETKKMVAAVIEGKSFTGVESWRASAEGELIPVLASGAGFLDSEGRLEGSIVTLRDMRERKRLEEQLSQSQKMQAVGTLASGIAHDFNNILQAVSGYVQLLLGGRAQGELQRGYLEEINAAVRRASELVQRLLTFGRKVEPRRRPVDLNREISQTAKVLRRTIPKMITIEMDLQPDLEPILGDAGQLSQVLMNLAANARDAMPDGGVLTIATASAELDEQACAGRPGCAPGPAVLWTVADTGRGMDAETLRQAFEPFFTTKAVGEGTGLGLSMVYGVVENHGGVIDCASEPGRGAVFRILLPAAQMDNVRDEPRAARQPTEAAGREKLLLVDDEEALLAIGRELLEGHGYQVLTATSGEEALEAYTADGAVDLVVLDLGMPGMGGWRCLAELRQRDAGAKVIVASGYLAEEEGGGPEAPAANAYLQKPYLLTELVATVRRVLDEA